jgi:hypothetical protein
MNEYSYRQSGTCGHELLNPDGQVFAWTVDAAWAGLSFGKWHWGD